MKKLLNEWRNFLNESSLSRLYNHILKYETAIMTGNRDDPNNLTHCTKNSVGKIDNKRRNKELRAILLEKNYGITKVLGSYIEDFDTPKAIEVSEDSIFVVNLHNDSDFFDTISFLGERFCQDSVLIIPKGGKNAYLLGTNNAEWPGYGEKEFVGSLDFGDEKKQFKTRVRGRPFAFAENANLEMKKKYGKNGRWAINLCAKSHLQALREKKKNN